MNLLEGLRQRAKRRDIYSTSDFWDGKARDYAGSAVSMFINRNLNPLLERTQFAFMDEALPDVSGRDVLDVGSGTGRLSRHLARRGARVSAFDFAAAAVAIAERENEGLPIETRTLSVFELEDVAVHDHAAVLGCLSAACRDADALRDAARRLHRALRPGARVGMIEPFHAGFLHRVLDMPMPGVRRVLEEAGFAVEDERPMHFWPFRLVLAPVEWPGFVTRAAHAVGETALRLPGPLGRMGDYTGLALRRLD